MRPFKTFAETGRAFSISRNLDTACLKSYSNHIAARTHQIFQIQKVSEVGRTRARRL